MKLRITISKYHSWYLCQISLQIMLLPTLICSSAIGETGFFIWRCRHCCLCYKIGQTAELAASLRRRPRLLYPSLINELSKWTQKCPLFCSQRIGDAFAKVWSISSYAITSLNAHIVMDRWQQPEVPLCAEVRA